MLAWWKKWLARYDAWCQSMGLTPDNKRSCCPLQPGDIQRERDKKTGQPK